MHSTAIKMTSATAKPTSEIRLGKAAIIGVALLGLCSASAFAQSPTERVALQENCTGDYLRLCGQYSPDGPEVEQCFKTRAKELSPDCSTAIAAFSKKNPNGRKR